MEGISERIAKVIEQTGMTKTAFAEKLNITQAYVSKISIGNKVPSDRTILDICREFGVNECWLRTGEGEMFIQKSRSDEIAAFVGDVIRDDSDFRRRFISVLSRMTTDEWKLLEKKVLELADEMKKADP